MASRSRLPDGRALAGAMVLAVGLAGCGFQPLYGDTPSGSFARAAVQEVAVSEIGSDRTGQILRNALIARLGTGGAPAYRLDVSVSELIADLLVQADAQVLRRDYELTASYVLVDLADGAAIHSGTVARRAGVNRVDSEYANVIAERDAAARAAESVADVIARRIGIVMAGQVAPAAPQRPAIPAAPAGPPAETAPRGGFPAPVAVDAADL